MRRVGLATVAVAAMAALAIAGCGDDGGDTTTDTTEAVVVEEFVGAVAGADTEAGAGEAVAGEYFVAVTTDGDEVLAYACDSVNAGQLFTGVLGDDGEVDLESESGEARLTATVTDTGVTGELTVNGESQPFEATLAEGIGGLYTLTPDGARVTGVSVRGNRFDATYDTVTFDYEGTFTTADGDVVPVTGAFPASKRAAGGYDEYRSVVLDTGVSRGARTATAKPVLGTAWQDPDPMP